MQDIQIFYGLPGRWTDVSEMAFKNCIRDNHLIIPAGEIGRCAYLWDVLPGQLKEILVRQSGNSTTYNWSQPIDIPVNNPSTSSESFVLAKALGDLEKIHNSLKFHGGSLLSEFDEQLMSILFIQPSCKVLEIGGNIGRNSCTIASILDRSENLVVVESSVESAQQLEMNRKENGFAFSIECSAISKCPLMQKGWATEPLVSGSSLPSGYQLVNTITWPELQDKYNIVFDTLVADCEGALYYILQDFPEILDNITLIIIENDFFNDVHQKIVHDAFKSHHFVCIYSKAYGGSKEFYQTWRKQ